MNIELFISKHGHGVFTCHGAFKQTIEEIILDKQTGVVKFVFQPDYREEEMNCIIHEELCNKLQDQLFCAIGYFKNNRLIASEYVRFSCRES